MSASASSSAAGAAGAPSTPLALVMHAVDAGATSNASAPTLFVGPADAPPAVAQPSPQLTAGPLLGRISAADLTTALRHAAKALANAEGDGLLASFRMPMADTEGAARPAQHRAMRLQMYGTRALLLHSAYAVCLEVQ